MSTKVTLDHGEDHHLFLEMFEAGKVYLTLHGAQFEARPGSVTVAVPLDVWERIRAVPIDSDFWDFGEDEPATGEGQDNHSGAG